MPDLKASKMRDFAEEFFPSGKPLDESVGERLASWVSGSSGVYATTDTADEDDFEAGVLSQETFERFKERLDGDLSREELTAIGKEIADEVDVLSPDHYKEIRALFGSKLEAAS